MRLCDDNSNQQTLIRNIMLAVACINDDGTIKDEDKLHRFLLSYTQWLSPDQMFSLLLGTAHQVKDNK
jgi:hypothetical protein